MIGAIIGDVGGSIYEFNNTFDYNMPLLEDGSTFTLTTLFAPLPSPMH
jgi:ADP-ribosyl-[dinitrogen reductase] hydrolase